MDSSYFCSELDFIEQISDEAAKVIKDSKSTSWYPENTEHVVAKLDKGLYHRLLMRFEVSVGLAGHPRWLLIEVPGFQPAT